MSGGEHQAPSAGAAGFGTQLQANASLHGSVILDIENQIDTRQAPAPTPDAGATGLERRRPGRLSHVSPHLVPLLRRQPADVRDQPVAPFDQPLAAPDHPPAESERPVADADQDDTNDLAPAIGIAVGVALSAPIWVGLIALTCWLS